MKINLRCVSDKVIDAGYAAYVEMTGGGVATIYASRAWAEPDGTFRPAPYIGARRAGGRLPQADAKGRFDVACGPGWYEPHWAAPNAVPYGENEDLCVGPDDQGEVEPIYCKGMSEDEVAMLIVTELRQHP